MTEPRLTSEPVRPLTDREVCALLANLVSGLVMSGTAEADCRRALQFLCTHWDALFDQVERGRAILGEHGFDTRGR